mgnify:CR=1 FL=1
MKLFIKNPVSFDKNCSLLMRANSVLYQERRKIYYFSISPFSLKNTVLSAPILVCQNNLIGLAAILCRFHRRFLDG